jgi:hypothetical protein
MDEAQRSEATGDSHGTYSDNVAQFTDKARQQADAAIERAADEMESASGNVRHMASEYKGTPGEMGTKLADEMHEAAGYLKTHPSRAIVNDVSAYVRQHPGKAIIGAIIAGFVVGRILH